MCMCTHTHTHTHTQIQRKHWPSQARRSGKGQPGKTKNIQTTATLLQPSTMKKPWALQQRARGEPRLPPSCDCNKASNTPPCQGDRKDHKESCNFHPDPATRNPLGPNRGISRDTDGMLRPPPILAAEMLLSPFLPRWHHGRLVGGLHLCQVLLGTGRPPVPNQRQWESNEELFPPPVRKASEVVVGSLGSHPCPAGRRSSAMSLGSQQKSTGQSGFPHQQKNKATPSVLCQFSVRGDPPKREISIKPRVLKHNTQNVQFIQSFHLTR